MTESCWPQSLTTNFSSNELGGKTMHYTVKLRDELMPVAWKKYKSSELFSLANLFHKKQLIVCREKS